MEYKAAQKRCTLQTQFALHLIQCPAVFAGNNGPLNAGAAAAAAEVSQSVSKGFPRRSPHLITSLLTTSLPLVA